MDVFDDVLVVDEVLLVVDVVDELLLDDPLEDPLSPNSKIVLFSLTDVVEDVALDDEGVLDVELADVEEEVEVAPFFPTVIIGMAFCLELAEAWPPAPIMRELTESKDGAGVPPRDSRVTELPSPQIRSFAVASSPPVAIKTT